MKTEKAAASKQGPSQCNSETMMLQHKLVVLTWVLFLQLRHSKVWFLRLAIAMRPQRLQTCTRYGSEASKRRSRRNCAAPWAIWQSRSISPKRRPPSLLKEIWIVYKQKCKKTAYDTKPNLLALSFVGHFQKVYKCPHTFWPNLHIMRYLIFTLFRIQSTKSTIFSSLKLALSKVCINLKNDPSNGIQTNQLE